MDPNSGRNSQIPRVPGNGSKPQHRWATEHTMRSDKDELTAPKPPLYEKQRRFSYTSIEGDRIKHYGLDYPEKWEELRRLQLDERSKYFARKRPRSLNLPGLLPYEIESPKYQANFLSHIVSHLYIAIKSLDIQGSLIISVNDLVSLKDAGDLSEVDLALETNIFEPATHSSDDVVMDDESNQFHFTDYLAAPENDYDDDDSYSGDEELEESNLSIQHKKSPKSAAVVSVRIWTHELLVWLRMKYDMPLSLRMDLAKVYYALCLCRGQDVNLKVYLKVFEALTKDYILLKEKGLILPWEGLLKEFENHFILADSLREQFEKKDHKLLVRLAERASIFFERKSLPHIFSVLASKFSITNSSLVLSSLAMSPRSFTKGGFDDPEDCRHYISVFFYMWAKLNKTPGIDSHVTSRLGSIAMSALIELSNNSGSRDFRIPGKYGLFSEVQIKFLFNALMNSLSIMKEKFGSLKTKFFHGFASLIIFSIIGDYGLDKNGILDQLETLVNAIESYVHPSNSGEWSRTISKLILSLVYQFHKRYVLENEKESLLTDLPNQYKLNDNVVSRFVKILLPVLKLGIQSKKDNVAEDYLTCYHLLAYLMPEEVLEEVLVDIYESLEGVISNHRVTAAIRTLEELVRYFASTKVFRVHLTNILQLTLPGVDSNDLDKTLHSLNFFAAVANFVPFHDLSDGLSDSSYAIQFTHSHLEYLQTKSVDGLLDGGKFTYTEEEEIEALKSASSNFKQIIKNLTRKIFLLLENLPDPSKSSGIEKDLAECLPKFIYIIIESLSDDIFKQFRDDFFEFVTNNTYHTLAAIVAEICGGLIKRDPSYLDTVSDLFIDKIREEITENNAGASRTGIDIIYRDQPLFWNIVILNECVGNGGQYTVKCGQKLIDLSSFLMDNVKGPAVFASSYLLNQILSSTTKIRINESRLISPAYEAKYGVTEKCWGGFQFDDYRFSDENLKFDWFIPLEKDVSFAVDFFQSYVSKCLDSFLKLMKKYTEIKDGDASSLVHLTDDMRLILLYLGYSISGISYLLDPSFEEDIPDLNSHETESVQQRLDLLKQIQAMTYLKNTPDDDLEVETLHENIGEIVKDLRNDELISKDSLFEETLENDFPSNSGGAKENVVTSNDSSLPDYKELESNKSSPSSSVRDSGSATPKLEGAEFSSLNPGVTFRERKLYTSRYFFGDNIDSRRSNEVYLRLHKTRNLIGKSLHMMSKFLLNYFHDNTKLFKHFLYVLSIWFSDVGSERLLDHSHAKISFDHVSMIQNINKVRKPYTRIAMGSAIESYHQLRLALHATSRSMTKLDKVLLEDVIKLSVSPYFAISKSAQSTLIEAKKRLSGSYGLIVRTSLKHLANALNEDNHKKIESGLSIFALKGINNRLQVDYSNMQKIVELLHKALQVDNHNVNEICNQLLKNLANNFALPSSTCLIDHDLIDCIRPPDEFIDLEIKAIRLAKERKRRLYLDRIKKLENYILSAESTSFFWKTSVINLSFLINIQLDIEMSLHENALKLLAKRASSDVPVISRLSLKGVSKIFSKVFHLSIYEYKKENLYDLHYLPKHIQIIDVFSSQGHEKKNVIIDHFKGNEESAFYVDQKPVEGWMFWEGTTQVVSDTWLSLLDLKSDYKDSLKILSSYITKDWFYNVVKLWVNEKDANSAFQGTDVFFTTTLIILIVNDFLEKISLDDIISVIHSIYVKDEKSTHIVVCELLAGLLVSMKFCESPVAYKIDESAHSFLKEIFDNDLNPDNRGIWTIFAWWVPTHLDSRRFPNVSSLITNFSIEKDSDFAFKEATRLSFIKSYASALTWSFPKSLRILNLCKNEISHHYQAIREQIGSLMATLTFSFFDDSFVNSEELISENSKGLEHLTDRLISKNHVVQSIPSIFEEVERNRLDIIDSSYQEILKSKYVFASDTILIWLNQALATSSSIVYQNHIVLYVIPFLMKLINMKEICQLTNMNPAAVMKEVSKTPFNDKNLERVVDILDSYSNTNITLTQFNALNAFTEIFYFKNLFVLTSEQRKRMIEMENKLIYHKSVEVREASAQTLSGFIHISPPGEIIVVVKTLSLKYINDLDRVRKKYRKSGYRNMDSVDNISIHGSTLGLGALVNAYPFSSPPPKWIAGVLTALATKSSGMPGMVGKAAKDILGKFKKNRQDTWHIDSRVFSESQIEDLEGVLRKSYFV